MALEFMKMTRGELRPSAELAVRAFDDYEYFTNLFPEKEERNKVQLSVILHEYKTNLGRAEYLIARDRGMLVAVAQIHSPSYRKPSDFCYFLHGWLSVYRFGDRTRIDEWLKMDAEAGQPCHAYQKTARDVWYISSLTVDPAFQGTGVGTGFLQHIEKFVRENGGREIIFFTNSQKNLHFYLRRGYEVFDDRELTIGGKKMGSWSLRRVIS